MCCCAKVELVSSWVCGMSLWRSRINKTRLYHTLKCCMYGSMIWFPDGIPLEVYQKKISTQRSTMSYKMVDNKVLSKKVWFQYYWKKDPDGKYKASLLGVVSISLTCLATGIFPIFQCKTAPAPSSWMGSAGVQQSLNHTTDSQLDWGLGFDKAIPSFPLIHSSVALAVCLGSLSC